MLICKIYMHVIYIFKIYKYICNIYTFFFFFTKTYAHVNTLPGPLPGLGKRPCKWRALLQFSPLILAQVCLQSPTSGPLYCLFHERIRTRIQVRLTSLFLFGWFFVVVFRFLCFFLLCIKNSHISQSSAVTQLVHQHILVSSLIFVQECVLLFAWEKCETSESQH